MRGIAFDGWILQDSAVFGGFFSQQGGRILRDIRLLQMKRSKCNLSSRETCPFAD